MKPSDHNRHRSIVVKPTPCLNKVPDARERIAEAMAGIQQSSLFSSRADRRVQKALRAEIAEQAVALVHTRIDLARETALQAIDLSLKQRRAELAQAETASQVELTKLSQAAADVSIQETIRQESQLQKMVLNSRCKEEDKALLSNLVRDIARESIDTTAGEHFAQFKVTAPPKVDES